MIYLYHSTPKELAGKTLYPLNILKNKFPEVYAKEAAKYAGRERLMDLRIPYLNCKWGDVIFLSPVPPEDIKSALVKTGKKPGFKLSYYKINPSRVNPKDTVIYLYSETNQASQLNLEDFIPYSPDELKGLTILPQATKDYYKAAIGKGVKPLLYHGIPHILYKGALDISGLQVYSV
jgi:hypothetical protein